MYKNKLLKIKRILLLPLRIKAFHKSIFVRRRVMSIGSTNVIVPEVSVITNVTFEHADKCGGTLEGIATHKAGIIKDGVPVVTGAEGEALEIIAKVAQEKKADLYVAGRDFAAEAMKPLGQLSIPPNLGATGYGVQDRSTDN